MGFLLINRGYPTMIFPSGITKLLFFVDILAVIERAREIGPTRPRNIVRMRTIRDISLETAVTPVVNPTVEKAETDSNRALIPRISSECPISLVKYMVKVAIPIANIAIVVTVIAL